MPTLSTLDFESGTAGNAIAAENGWAVAGAGGTYIADAAHDSLAGRFQPPGSGALEYDVSALTRFRLRTYLRVGTQTQTGHQFLIELRDAANAYLADLQIRNVNGGELWNRWGYSSYTDSAPGAYLRDTWRRVDYEYAWNDGEATNNVTVYVYNPADDTAIDYTLQVPSWAAVSTLRVGAPQIGGVTADYDSLKLTTGEDPGPYGAGGPTLTVWDGASEVAATLTEWDGASEQPATLE